MGFENGLKEGLFTQKSKYNLRKNEMMLQNLVLQHPLCLHSEGCSESYRNNLFVLIFYLPILLNAFSLIIFTSSIFIAIRINPYPPIPITAEIINVRRLLATKCFTTNLVYHPVGLMEKPWYTEVNMCKYVALIIDTLY